MSEDRNSEESQGKSSDVRSITFDELNALGIDSNNSLYWHGKRVVTQKKFALTERLIGSIGVFSALVVAIVTAWSWGCDLRAGGSPYCPAGPIKEQLGNNSSVNQ